VKVIDLNSQHAEVRVFVNHKLTGKLIMSPDEAKELVYSLREEDVASSSYQGDQPILTMLRYATRPEDDQHLISELCEVKTYIELVDEHYTVQAGK